MRFMRIGLAMMLVLAAMAWAWGTMSGAAFKGKPSDLLGLSPCEVVERLGLPDSGGHTGGALSFDYSSHYDGEPSQMLGTVYFHKDRAFWVHPDFRGVEDPKTRPTEGTYVGQPVVELIERLGQPEDFHVYSGPGLTLLYQTQEIAVGHGFVVGVNPRQPAKARR